MISEEIRWPSVGISDGRQWGFSWPPLWSFSWPPTPLALLEWFPQALLFGFWQSHLGKKGSQAKLARSWISEVVGYEPAAADGEQLGLKGDPLNLSVDEQVQFDPNDVTDWELIEGSSKAGGGKAKERLSEIGHGQVPVGGTLSAVSCREIEQQTTVSFAGLRRIWVNGGESNALARALLASLGLVAHVATFGRSFSLRSDCELRPVDPSWTWLGGAKDEPVEPPTIDDAVSLFRACAERAEAGGLPVGGRWMDEPLVLTPKKSLADAIRSTYPLDE
ncbi:MAG: type I-G CRISPR-associated protein Cas7 [Actinomycetota bacterium]